MSWWVAAKEREVKVKPLFNLLLHTTFYVNNKTPWQVHMGIRKWGLFTVNYSSLRLLHQIFFVVVVVGKIGKNNLP